MVSLGVWRRSPQASLRAPFGRHVTWRRKRQRQADQGSKCGLQRDPERHDQRITGKRRRDGSKVKPADRTLARVATHPLLHSTRTPPFFQSPWKKFGHIVVTPPPCQLTPPRYPHVSGVRSQESGVRNQERAADGTRSVPC